jgi:predicted nucleotidyltransferase
MPELSLPQKIKKICADFTERLKDIYGDGLISVILYGSAASGEFIDKHSNLNLLVILKDTDLGNLKKSSFLINKFSKVSALFLTESYVLCSIDIFPIEFLDMQENYFVLYGKDILKEINIDTRNLRFQCEQELKMRLISLRQLYLGINEDTAALRNLLFKSFTSILHIARNVLRLKGKKPAYMKEEILKELAAEFRIDKDVWGKILKAKAQRIKLNYKDTEELFINFTREVEKIVDIVDKL